MNPSPPQDRPLYNSRIIDSYIRLARLRYPYVNIGELLQYAGMKGYEVADQAHWFTQDQINRFYERLVQLTGNPHISREAGRYAASPEALGAMRQYVLGLIGASNAFGILNKTTANFTRSSIYESRRISSNKVEITVTPQEDGLEQPFQCENRIGFFEAVVLIFNPSHSHAHRFPDIQHPECIFKGGKVCRYFITWEKSHTDILRKVKNGTILLLAFMNLALIMLGQWAYLDTSLLASLCLALLLIVAVDRSEKNEMMASLAHTKDSNEDLLNQININYNNALMTNEIGRTVGAFTEKEDILTNVIEIMKKRLEYDRGLIFLANREETRLELQASYGYGPEQLGCLARMSFRLDRPVAKGVLSRAYREQRPFLVNDLQGEEESLSSRSLTFAKMLEIRSFICCPIICEGTSMGILAADTIKNKRPLIESDMSLLMGIASMIGISLRNSALIDAGVRQFKSLLQVLAASIDARDSLTAGHSEKVTEYALGTCKEIGLAADYCEMIRVAALLHDYGKIGVPDDILKKKGKLTTEEFEIVKEHAASTAEILGKVNFEGIYSQVPEIAGAHHEKMDGSGYPRGLKGEEIPLGARIIAVSDYFESVTAKRHYRDPLPVDEAFALLRQESGGHLDKKLVEALISYYSRTYKQG
ncbi:HD domain-containing phosphohydrolase [Pelotalea chapellei]|uniref:HD domain-containing protein n=1 Tax=Pelotalea chapellei TaxID=44671 RepID=A0ABS5UBX9_9BACT|nr:HD domain-containing phosphohydrolase [Pelotalea chapellei]MBT1073197.1 HD domain-containing protein [Pelotalea chapellei]